MTQVRRGLAGAIVVVAVLGVAVALASHFGARTHQATSTITDAVTAVEVDSTAGPVDVVAGTGTEVRLRRTERYLLGAPIVRQSVVDGILRVRAGCPRLGAPACEVRLRLELPATVTLRVRADRGAVSVTGIAGAVDVATEAGAISLTGGSGPMTARTTAGAIRGVDLSPLYMDASTTAGAIRLSLARPSARVDLRTGAGAVEVTLPPDRYRVETHAATGKADVGVVVDPTSPFAVRVTTTAGAIRIRPR
jgi:hypothetical protein